jgi:hypothetical protein
MVLSLYKQVALPGPRLVRLVQSIDCCFVVNGLKVSNWAYVKTFFYFPGYTDIRTTNER